MLPQGVPHLPEGGHDLRFGAGGLGRVREAHVHDFGFPGKDGTLLLGLVADRDHQVEGFPGQVVHRLGSMLADIDAQLRHDLDGPGVDPAGPHPRGPGLNLPGQIVVHQSFGHLAAAGVFGAEKQDFQHEYAIHYPG